MTMDKLGSLIPNSLKRGGADRTVLAAMVSSAVEAAMAEIVPASIGKVRMLSAKKGIVRAQCDSSIIAEEIRLHEREIIESAALSIGDEHLQRIIATA